jgi:hypothetical protein
MTWLSMLSGAKSPCKSPKVNGQNELFVSVFVCYLESAHLPARALPGRNPTQAVLPLNTLAAVALLCADNSSIETASAISKTSSHFEGVLSLFSSPVVQVFRSYQNNMIRCPPRLPVAAPAPKRRPLHDHHVCSYNRRFSAGKDEVRKAAAEASSGIVRQKPYDPAQLLQTVATSRLKARRQRYVTFVKVWRQCAVWAVCRFSCVQRRGDRRLHQSSATHTGGQHLRIEEGLDQPAKRHTVVSDQNCMSNP